MSNFKKMRLVDFNAKSTESNDVFNMIKHETPTHLRRVNDLDLEIKDILNSEIDEENKAKLYTQALRRFITFKNLHEDQQLLDESRKLDLLKKIVKPRKRKKTQTAVQRIHNQPVPIIQNVKKTSPIKKKKKTNANNQKTSPKKNGKKTSKIKDIDKPSTSGEKSKQSEKNIIKTIKKEDSSDDTLIEISSDDDEKFQDPWMNYS